MRSLAALLAALVTAGAALLPAQAQQRYQEPESYEGEGPRGRERYREEADVPRSRDRRDGDEAERPRSRERRDGDEEARAERRRPRGRVIRAHPAIGGRCADVPESRFRPGVRLQTWACHGGGNQLFRARGEEITIAGLCLEPAGRGRRGERVVLEECEGRTAQRWSFERAGRGFVQIVNGAGRCLDVHEGNPRNGAQLIVYDCIGTANQLFSLEQP